jgi:hypothetical protein
VKNESITTYRIDQVRINKDFESYFCSLKANICHGRRDMGAEARPGVNPKCSEDQGGLRGELLIGPGECGTDDTGWVRVNSEKVQWIRCALQLLDEVR